ncbi:MAG: hypothetical protein AAGB11_13845 [Pseudomonadota bacterium]
MNVSARPLITAKPWDGNTILGPGVFSDLPLAKYHSQVCSVPEISSSGLHIIENKSPAHYWDQSYLNKDAEKKPPSRPMVMGSAAHHLLFGESGFYNRFIVRPAKVDGETWHPNKKICKEWLAQQAELGLEVITQEEKERIEGIAESLDRHPIAAGFLHGQIEVSMIDFVDVALPTGQTIEVAVKSRPDVFPTFDLTLGDLKVGGEGSATPAPRT